MGTFNYKARDEEGKQIEGKIEAKDEASAISLLQDQKLFITSLSKTTGIKTFSGFSSFFNKVPLKEKIMFTTQMAVMVKSGLPILEAVKTVEAQTQNKNMSRVLDEVIKDISSGLSFSKALSKHPEVFNETYVKILESGEKSGRLDKVLLKLSKDLDKDYDLVGKIRSALMYPAFILIVLIVVMIVVLVYVIPQLKTIFNDVGVQLPLLTRMIVAISDFMVKFWWLLLIIIIIFVILLRRYLKTDKGSYAFDKLKLKTPVLKQVMLNIYMSRFTRTLSSLVSAGIPMIDVLNTTKGVIGSSVFEKEVEKIIVQVESGSSVSKAMKDSPYFPPVVTSLVAVGEKSGKTDYILKNLSRFLEKEVDNTVRNLTSLLEPVIMVVLGVGIAIVIISVIMPIYGLVQVIQ
ncbi:MAG: type II secretion system F family protein [Candidatus Berkelbacteria bacterium]|nr:type II secretion system F family protein [Candidatus Berkelbacteria bacterium]